MKTKHPFQTFLDKFIPEVAEKSRQLNKAFWILETTGSSDAADLKASLDNECRLLFHSKKTFGNLLKWDQDPSLKEPLLKRQLNVLIRAFKQNQIPKALVKEISQKEAALSQSYVEFRPKCDGKVFSENEILDVLKNEDNPEKRKKIWNASKSIGEVLAPQILALVDLRNKAAASLGYSDYFKMQLDLQEVNEKWLLDTLEDLSKKSDAAYGKVLHHIEEQQTSRFKVSSKELGPWAWSEPFCQGDPLDSRDLDALVADIDIVERVQQFYDQIGFDVRSILKRSDNYERPGKNQHAFCINMDRKEDVRTLNNVKPSIRWLETVLHELGHAVYELGFCQELPWLLRDPPHMITTEAMALLAGRQAYRVNTLKLLITGKAKNNKKLMQKAEESLIRRQLIFSRWVLVMTHFERELYRNPRQNLNQLWWQMVEKYQKIRPPKGREGKSDWAAKYHMGLAPVYYFSYLLGEMFASSIEDVLTNATGSPDLISKKVAKVLGEKLFFPGNRMNWMDLIKHVTGKRLNAEAWLKQFA